MAKYVLGAEFQMLNETRGTIVNSSNVKAEISDQPNPGTGVILYPYEKFSFNHLLYAARAPSECGVAIIGVIEGDGNGNVGNPLVITDPDEFISYPDIASLFGNVQHHENQGVEPDTPVTPVEPEETVSDDDIDSLFDDTVHDYSQDTEGEQITEEEINNLFSI